MEQVLTLAPDVTGWRLIRPAELPLGALLLGRPVAEVASTLPRLFNLCRVAQGMAARLALGLPDTGDADALRDEILRDHMLRLMVTLPPLAGLSPRAPTADQGLALFGPVRRLPDSPEALTAWLAAGQGMAPLVARIAMAFDAGEASARPLPVAGEGNALSRGAVENSAAARQIAHPLLRAVEARHGRGPLWRVLGMLADAEAALARRLPAPRLVAGVALVPAARGQYALALSQAGGLVSRIERVTPTDHATAPDGPLASALDALPRDMRHLAPLVVALHDPCMGVRIEEPRDA